MSCKLHANLNTNVFRPFRGIKSWIKQSLNSDLFLGQLTVQTSEVEAISTAESVNNHCCLLTNSLFPTRTVCGHSRELSKCRTSPWLLFLSHTGQSTSLQMFLHYKPFSWYLNSEAPRGPLPTKWWPNSVSSWHKQTNFKTEEELDFFRRNATRTRRLTSLWLNGRSFDRPTSVHSGKQM